MIKNPETKTVRIPLVGSLFKRDSSASVTSDQYFTNCAFKKMVNQGTEKESILTSKRLGFSSYQATTGTTGAIDAIYMPVFDSAAPLVLWDGGTDAPLKKRDTTIATFTNYGVGVCSRMTACWSTSPTIHAVAVWNIDGAGARTAKFYPDSGAVTTISDVDFPTTSMTGNFVFIDGYLLIMTEDGFIYNSDLNSLTSWDATNYIPCGFKSDDGVTVARYKNAVVAFGRATTEFFENVGNATGSPLQRIPERAFNIGMYKDDTTSTLTSAVSPCRRVLEAFDTIFWISSSYGDSGHQSIFYLDNFQPAELTTPDMASIFAYDTPDKILGAFHYAGEPVLIIKTGAGDYYVCFIRLKMWSKWSFGTGSPVAFVGGAAQTLYADMGTTQVKMTFNNQSSASYQDNGSAYTMTIQTSKLDFDSEKRKRLHKLAVIGNDTGVTSTTNISWSDDDYLTFNTPRAVDMNAARPYLTNCGAFRRRAFKVTNASNAPFEITAIELDLFPLTK